MTQSDGMTLPVDEVLADVVAALRGHGCCVVTAPPGSGKTTRVPPGILESGLVGDGQVILLQPRRVAARACARFMARQHGTPLGDRVGYAIRMERRAGPDTRLLVVTEGVLTRRLQDDPFLDGVSCVVLDEFHERSLHADLGLALLREVRQDARPDLKIVVMSATLDPEPVSEFLGGAPIVTSDGSLHPVDVHYLEEPDERPIAIQAAAGVRRMLKETAGDVLVFLPGAGEIARTSDALSGLDADVLPLHGDLPPDAQDRALTRGGGRKVILSTNVAETSLTIEGVSAVVDSGLVRRVRHDPRLGVDRLELGRISRASADQRAGRAGRLARGSALRLWTRARHRELAEQDEPEVRRVDLASTVLELRAWGCDDPAAFGWFEAPPAADLKRAVELLESLGALSSPSGVSDVGRRLLRLPVHPRFGALLLEAARLGVLDDGARVCAMLSERDILRSARAFGDDSPHPTGPSDLLLRLDLLSQDRDPDVDGRAARRVEQTARRLKSLVGRSDGRPSGDPDEALGRALLRAFPDRVARRRGPDDPRAVMVGGRGLELDRRTVVREAELFVAVALDAGRRGHGSTSRVRLAHAIDIRWLEEDFPGGVDTAIDVSFDVEREAVVGLRRTRYRDLVLDERPAGKVDPARCEAVLAEAVKAHPDRALRLAKGLDEWLLRVRCLREWRPDLELPSFDRDAIIEALVNLVPGCSSFADLRKAPLGDLLRGRLTHEQRRAVREEAPSVVELPNGRTVRLRYEEGRPPVLSAKVQHLFGVPTTPTVAGGRVPVLVELLAPNQRPVQLTQDLASFWANTYSQVRKDLRGRYPKHDWPETPPVG